jgi:hypothetical protein
MTTTTQEKNSGTTTPACPSWCHLEAHVIDHLTADGKAEWCRDNGGLPHDGEEIMAARDHEGVRGHWLASVWVSRADVLLEDGTWRVGRAEVTTPDGRMTPEIARTLAASLIDAADVAATE